MFSKHFTSILLFFTAVLSVSSTSPSISEQGLNNKLAITPPMGWNSYNHYSCSPNESIVTSNAKALVDLGLQAAGYHYVTVDCGWSLPTRTTNGALAWNPDRFPSGAHFLAQLLHAFGLGFGVYSDAGIKMCMTGPPEQNGSLGYEKLDAYNFARLGADLLKYDNCYSDAASDYPETQYWPSKSPSPNYVTMSNALASTQREILYMICNWGVDFPSAWAPDLGNTWRVTNDIIPAYRTIPRILNQVVPQTSFAGPGRWLDLDMLMVGNKIQGVNVFTTPEEQTHFSLWSIIKSPLIIGAGLNDTFTSIDGASLEILRNPSVISYNQDSLGVAASFRRRWTNEGYEVWAGPLTGNRTVAAVINLLDKSQSLTLDLPVVGLQSAGLVKDIWNNLSLQRVLTSYSALVEPHGTLLLELQGTTAAGFYQSAFASTKGYLLRKLHSDKYILTQNSTTTTFQAIYGITSSERYGLVITFAFTSKSNTTIEISTSYQKSMSYTLLANRKTLAVSLGLFAARNNTIYITSLLTPSFINITSPSSRFYPAGSFTLSGNSVLSTCSRGLCYPAGTKIQNMSPTGSASITLSAPASAHKTSSKFLNLYFCNNDIAIADTWTGTNTRNLTLTLNQQKPVRVELPLSGRSSELFSPGLGWEDTGIFGVLMEGWIEGAENELVVGNVNGEEGVQISGADLVGVELFW